MQFLLDVVQTDTEEVVISLFSINLENMDFKEKLIAAVKKEVKQVMEEAVTRKFIHEESGSVTSLCAGQYNH